MAGGGLVRMNVGSPNILGILWGGGRGGGVIENMPTGVRGSHLLFNNQWFSVQIKTNIDFIINFFFGGGGVMSFLFL